MRCHHLYAAVLVAISAAPVLSAQEAAEREAAPAMSRFAGVAFPSEFGSWLSIRADRFANPALGMFVRYVPRGTRARADVYVYPLRGTLEEEFALAREEIESYAERSQGRISATIDSTGEARIGDHSGRVAIASVTQGGETERSLLYLFAKDGAFVKYRVAMDPAIRLTFEAPLQAFLAETLARIVPPPAAAADSAPPT